MSNAECPVSRGIPHKPDDLVARTEAAIGNAGVDLVQSRGLGEAEPRLNLGDLWPRDGWTLRSGASGAIG
jgi:hypothetical protein